MAGYLKLAKEKPESIQVWFWDGAFKVAKTLRHTAPHECGFSLRVIRRRCWTRKGKRKKVKGQRRRGRVNMMGGLRYSDKKRICFMIKKGDSLTFYEQLIKLNESVKQEWINKDNKADNFEKEEPRILIILDNASFHKKTEILSDIDKNLPRNVESSDKTLHIYSYKSCKRSFSPRKAHTPKPVYIADFLIHK